MKRIRSDSELRCSFCNKSQDVVGKLISSPSDHPRAYICNECIAICNSILEDDRKESAPPAEDEPDAPHPLLGDPLASELMEAIVDWMRAESLGQDAADELGRVHEIARRMMRGG